MKTFKKVIHGATILLSAILLFSCKPHHPDNPEPETTVVTIMSPTEAQEFEKGDTILIKVKITSVNQMHGYDVHVTRLADTTEIIDKDANAHAMSFDVSEFFVNDGMVHSDMELEVKAIIDHNGNSVSKKVRFHCHTH